MASTRSSLKKHVIYHRDGSVWARGQMAGGAATGYREWYRTDGTRMRSGYFKEGRQVGEWTTYDRKGKVYKVTMMRERPATGAGARRARR